MTFEVKVYLDGRGYHQFFETWNGNTGRYMRRLSKTLEYRTRAGAPVRSGALKRAIGTYYGKFNGELEARVGANPSPSKRKIGYAYFMHEGTRPHIIRPRQARYLRFVQNGHVVYATIVHHPGTRPRPYITRWLREVVR